MKDLEQIFLEEDRNRRVTRTARHEAGHAAAAWLLKNSFDDPPFEYIDLGTIENQAGGVVPGAVKHDPKWFSTIGVIEQGMVLLAGIYVQDHETAYSAQDWRTLLDSLDGTDGIDDYARAIEVASSIGRPQHDFDEDVRSRIVAIETELLTLTDFVASCLSVGARTSASTIRARWRSMQIALSGGVPGSS